jgi:hypothetical protein
MSLPNKRVGENANHHASKKSEECKASLPQLEAVIFAKYQWKCAKEQVNDS